MATRALVVPFSSVMVAHVVLPRGEQVAWADQRILLSNTTWEHFEAELAFRGERSAPRISFLDGALEILRPSRDHERIKSYLGRLVEAYALERGIVFSPFGSWTLRARPKQAGVEPDECYLFHDLGRETPDLVIEVVWTSGGIDKLEAYRRLGVPEVWSWKDDALHVWVLEGDAYEQRATSLALPGLDLVLLASLVDRPSAYHAVKELRAAMAPRG